jgi:hypothetical protein
MNVPGPASPIFAVLEAALARHVGPEAAAFVQAVFSLYDPAELIDLLTAAGFATVEAWSIEKTLPLPAPEDFLWQYVHSMPLAGPAADLDDEQRMALEDEVVAGCKPFIEDGALVLRQPITITTARR